MIKQITIALFVFFSNSSFGQMKIIDSIHVRYVNPDVTTPFSIPCDKFEVYLSNANTFKVKQSELWRFYKVLEWKSSNDLYDALQDVRAKFIIYLKSSDGSAISTKEICVNRFSEIMYNNSLVSNPEVIVLIKRYLKIIWKIDG